MRVIRLNAMLFLLIVGLPGIIPGKVFGQEKAKNAGKRHALVFNVLEMTRGYLSVGLESRLSKHWSARINGGIFGYTSSRLRSISISSYKLELQPRYHFRPKEDKNGKRNLFCGPYVSFQEMTTDGASFVGRRFSGGGGGVLSTGQLGALIGGRVINTKGVYMDIYGGAGTGFLGVRPSYEYNIKSYQTGMVFNLGLSLGMML